MTKQKSKYLPKKKKNQKHLEKYSVHQNYGVASMEMSDFEGFHFSARDKNMSWYPS